LVSLDKSASSFSGKTRRDFAPGFAFHDDSPVGLQADLRK
jgi:hypothetical protein